VAVSLTQRAFATPKAIYFHFGHTDKHTNLQLLYSDTKMVGIISVNLQLTAYKQGYVPKPFL